MNSTSAESIAFAIRLLVDNKEVAPSSPSGTLRA
jgi:hypothetical protein